MDATKAKKKRHAVAVEDEVGEVVKPFRRKSKKNEGEAGTSTSPEVLVVASTIERLLTQITEKSKKIKGGIHCLRENTQLLISTNKLDKELREEEIEQCGLEARMRPPTKKRMEEEESRLTAIAVKFEKELLDDSDVERPQNPNASTKI